jgi:hypothetical protein
MMNIINNKFNTTGFYVATGVGVLVYAGLLIAFAVYNQFFYIDGTWFHGFVANGFSVFSGLILMAILFVFKRFLNGILAYSKANWLINVYIGLLALFVFSMASVLIQSAKVYLSLDGSQSMEMLANFGASSFTNALFMILSSVGIMLCSMLLGNRLRKIGLVNKSYFIALGLSFMAYGLGSLLQLVTIVEGDTLLFVLKSVMMAFMGYILLKTSEMEVAVANLKLEQETNATGSSSREKLAVEISQEIKSKSVDRLPNKGFMVSHKRKSIAELEVVEVPELDLDTLENKDEVLSYFNNLTKEELVRLEFISAKNYKQDLTNEQKSSLVLQHISANKLYDHQRFAPK